CNACKKYDWQKHNHYSKCSNDNGHSNFSCPYQGCMFGYLALVQMFIYIFQHYYGSIYQQAYSQRHSTQCHTIYRITSDAEPQENHHESKRYTDCYYQGRTIVTKEKQQHQTKKY